MVNVQPQKAISLANTNDKSSGAFRNSSTPLGRNSSIPLDKDSIGHIPKSAVCAWR